MNRGELEILVADYLHRTDTDTIGAIPGFITLTTARIGRDLRSQENQTILDPFQPAAEISALPVDYRQIKSLSYLSGRIRIDVITATAGVLATYPRTGNSPQVYNVIGKSIEIAPFSPIDMRLIYFNAPAELVDTDSENEILTAYPYIYLYGALIEGFTFTQDGGGRDTVLATFGEEVELINKQTINADTGARPRSLSTRRRHYAT